MSSLYYREVNAQMGDERLAISVCKYRVVKKTPKGVWIIPSWAADDWPQRKFILHTSGQKFAWPTRELARTSFIIRKHREIQHTSRQHDRAVRYLALAETGKFGTDSAALSELRIDGMPLFEMRV